MRFLEQYARQQKLRQLGLLNNSSDGANSGEPISTEQSAECPECPQCGCNEGLLLKMPEMIKSPSGGATWPVPGKAWCANCNLTFRVEFED
jgi:hypothetical protein